MNRKTSVIIAEDQKSYRDGLISLMIEFNIQIIGEAENGYELLELLKVKKPDVVLLDLEMPKLDGSKTFDIIIKDYPSIKVIIVSQFDDGELIKSFFARGAKAYMPKNTDIEIFVQAIRVVKENCIYRDNVSFLFKTNQVTDLKKNLFTGREREIIKLLCEGLCTFEIANLLSVVEKTVEAHVTEIYRKTNKNSRAQFLIYATKEGLNYLE